MKIRKYILILFITMLIIWWEGINVLAMNTGFSTKEMLPKNKEIFLSNVKVAYTCEEPPKCGIECFDINDNGLVVIGFENFQNKYISIYDSSGNFKYGYCLKCNGDFGVQWNDDENLIIYFVRGNVAALINKNGSIIDLEKIKDTRNNSFYWDNSVFSKKKKLNGNTYIVKNNMGLLNVFSSSYSQLVKINEDGNSTILLDNGKSNKTKITFIGLLVLIFITFVIFMIVREFKKLKIYH